MAIDNRLSKEDIENLSFDRDFGKKFVEGLGFDGVNLQRNNANNMSLEIDYVGGTNPIYMGNAAPGTPTSSALWKIVKLSYDGNNNVTSILYAGGSPSFNQVWDNRASLSYS